MMKQALRLWLLMLPMLAACSGSDNDDPTPVTPTETTGEVSFSINNANGGGTGSGSTPAIVSKDHPLDMAISQRSSYTDPDGSVYTCEPKASIKLSVARDTLYAKDLQTLVSVTEKSDTKQSGTNPQSQQTVQTFNIGGQEVAFNLAHEIYTYVNSQNKSIEMPYIKVNPAKYGAVGSKESTRSASASVTGIRLKPINAAATRGQTVTTSQAYEVNVAFNLELESVNTKSANTQSLSFEVDYIGVVETSTELPDPVTQFTYKMEVLGGTANTASPFTLTNGETLSLQWNEESRYSYFSAADLQEKTILYEPKVKVSLTAATDTVWAAGKTALEAVTPSEPTVTTSGASPAVTAGHQVLAIGGQSVTIDWSYEAYADVSAEGNTAAMPYLELGAPKVVAVTAVEQSNATVAGKDAKVYEVTAHIAQELKSVNAAEPVTENIEYVVKYIGVEEIKLVKVQYRKSWEWVDAYCNIALGYFPTVYRDRIYSTGETFTDTFMDYGHFASWGCMPILAGDGSDMVWDDKKIVYSDFTFQNVCDSINIVYQEVGVPDLSKALSVGVEDYGYYPCPPGTWNQYSCLKSYKDEGVDVSLADAEVSGAYGTSQQESGWYLFGPEYNRVAFLAYDEENIPYGLFLKLQLMGDFPDQYLVIDGQMITFSEFRGELNFNFKEESTTMPDGSPAKVFTHEVSHVFMGKRFYAAVVGTVYQLPDGGSASARTSQPATSAPRRSAAPASRRPASKYAGLPTPYDIMPKFIYGGRPGDRKGHHQ